MFYLLALLVAFIAIVMWAFSKKRRRRFEQDARIPFEDGKNKGD
ncbi:MAG: cbb3-type cytochrome oxidase subunit 3 [Burkholderiales bacterium]